LRIGYVSADLRDHPVGQCIEALLGGCESLSLESYFYVSQATSDERTGRIRELADGWCDVLGWSDPALAEQIRGDRIDILVDLSGHTFGHRLPVFALRPAPIQLSWLGYFGTTGLEAMDFVLGDWQVLPEGAEADYTEKLLRMERPYGCFLPPRFPLAVTPPPCLMKGHVTFGCFNNLLKINSDVVRQWSQLLDAVPTAILFLKTPVLSMESVRARTRDRLLDAGIAEDRIRLDGKSPQMQHIAAYGEVDIALDPFPCSGGMTTAEASWMGVPVVTLASDRFAGRISATLLHSLGHDDWIARDPAEYVKIATELAADSDRLVAHRARSRARFMESELCDGEGLARALVRIYRGLWQQLCSQGTL